MKVGINLACSYQTPKLCVPNPEPFSWPLLVVKYTIESKRFHFGNNCLCSMIRISGFYGYCQGVSHAFNPIEDLPSDLFS